MTFSRRFACFAVLAVTCFSGHSLIGQELKLEPIPMPQPATQGPTLAQEARLMPGDALVIEPPVVVEQPAPVVIAEPNIVARPMVTTSLAPVVRTTTHYVYRPLLRTFTPVSVTVEPAPPVIVETPIPAVTTVVVVPRHVPGQPIRNMLRRRL